VISSTSYGLKQIAEKISARAAHALVEHFGGTVVEVPLKAKRNHPLTKKLGKEMAAELVFHFAGSRFYIPRFFVNPIFENARRIQTLDDGSRTVTTVAREADVTERTVYKHRAKVRGSEPEDGRQPSLFHGKT